MILGYVRDRFPRVTLQLPGLQGLIDVEFIVNTGFDGDLSLPGSLISQIEATASEFRLIQAVGEKARQTQAFEVLLGWHDEERITEVIILENAPLLGVGLMEGSLLQAEMQTGGEVLLEPL